MVRYIYFILILSGFKYCSAQDYVSLDLDIFNSIEYNVDGNVKGYSHLPKICHIDNDTIYMAISEMNEGVRIFRFIKDKFLYELKIESQSYIYFDFIINGAKYIRFFKDNNIYFLDKTNFLSFNNLTKIPNIETNEYLKKMSNNSLNFSSENFDIFESFYYNNKEIVKIGLDTIPIDIFPQVDDAVQYYYDGGVRTILMYALKNAILFPFRRDTCVTSTIDRLKIKRNTIFAYYGKTFKTKWLQEYFDKQFWYTPNPNYSDDLLNSFDKEEIQILLRMEKGLEN